MNPLLVKADCPTCGGRERLFEVITAFPAYYIKLEWMDKIASFARCKHCRQPSILTVPLPTIKRWEIHL